MSKKTIAMYSKQLASRSENCFCFLTDKVFGAKFDAVLFTPIDCNNKEADEIIKYMLPPKNHSNRFID